MKRYFLVFAVFGLLFLVVGGVAAHAELRSAVPAPGESLTEQPGKIRLTFSEAVRPGSTITLFGEGFREIGGVEARVDPEQADVLVAVVPELAAGTYSVNWLVVSVDGHPASGSYTFGVLAEAEGDGVSLVFWGGVVVVAIGVGLVLLWGWRTKKIFVLLLNI